MKIEVDALRKVRREIAKEIKIVTKKRHRAWAVILLILLFIGLANFSFWGTLTALEIKDRVDILKIFQSGRYLVLLQNNAEMRPTGGFIGSFAIVEFKDYKIANIDFNTNIYKLDNAFTAVTQVDAPMPLATINDNHWTLHDANWAPDFLNAAQTIQWFYEQETGDKVDGVIVLNASSVQNLLRLTGSIELPSYDTIISSDNFFDELASKIEKEYFYNAANQITNEPKSILKDMLPILIAKTKNLSKLELLKLALTELNQKQILLQSNDQTIEQAILAMNWGGKIVEADSDYLYINNANLTDTTKNKNWGAKTSLKIKEAIDYQITEQADKLISDLTLTRSHIGSYQWPDGVNLNWTRILVPAGSTLRSAELNGKDITNSIEIGSEAGKTYFGLWINTAPQTSNVLKISYQLPISANNSSNYHLNIQKQPGNLGDDLKVSFGDKVLFNGVLDTDLVLAF